MNNLDHIETFLLDMDGTIYLGERLIDGAAEFLAEIKRRGKRYLFLTNNSSKNRLDYVAKLKKLGIAAKPDEIFTSGEASVIYLRERYPGGRVVLLGTPSLELEFMEAGFALERRRSRAVDFVLLGFDTTLTYDKLWTACDYVRNGAPFYATHPDLNCPLEGGRVMPDAGAMIKLVEAATGISPEIIGKPYMPMVDGIVKKYGLERQGLAIVGDRLYTDIALARRAGIASFLVFSGETSPADLAASDIRPDFAVDSVREIFPA